MAVQEKCSIESGHSIDVYFVVYTPTELYTDRVPGYFFLLEQKLIDFSSSQHKGCKDYMGFRMLQQL